ncbi:MAG: 50S ribosomal protein L25 [Candidatus Omnitrophica bacterium]|jgi:large subunit ribosomal protein L25|nr:50S ribosomal protein L25 [Candidatus Omnitrophota bacterium]
MKQVSLSVEARTTSGKSANKVIRRAGNIPAVVYHHGEVSSSVTVVSKELDQILHSEAGQNALINLTVKDEPARKDPRLVVLKEVQHHPVTGTPIHVDFQQISLTEKTRFVLPVILKGESVGVKTDGGVLEAPIREIAVRCLVTQLPEHIEIDITNLKLNDSIHMSDVKLPEGLEVLTDSHAVLAHVAAPFVEKPVDEAAATSTEPERIEKPKKEVEGEAAKGGDAKAAPAPKAEEKKK